MLTFNNKIITSNTKWINKPIDPLNPLDLPAYTIAIRFKDGVVPVYKKVTAEQVSTSPNIWYYTYNNPDWSGLFDNYVDDPMPCYVEDMLEILGANTTGVTNMYKLFANNRGLSKVQLFDTSRVTNMAMMFGNYMGSYWSDADGLKTIPQFDISSVTDVSGMFSGQGYVESGIYEFYQRLIAKSPVPRYRRTNPSSGADLGFIIFFGCGEYSQTGTAERLSLPGDWYKASP